MLTATRSDLDVLPTGYASIAAQSLRCDCVVLIADALPGEEPATRATQITSTDLLGRTRANELGYTLSRRAFIDVSLRAALAFYTQRYRRVVVLPPRSLLLGSLETFFERLEECDVDADVQADPGWFGRRLGNLNTSTRSPFADELTRSTDARAGTAAVQLPAGDALATLPPAVAAAYMLHYQPGRSRLYRFGSFSNGIRFDAIARTLYAEALAVGHYFDDPGDVHADPSFFTWLRSFDGDASPYLRGYIAHHGLLDTTADGVEIERYVESIKAPDLDPIWLTKSARHVPRRQTATSLGVNVAGCFRAEVGIGEAGRSMAKALAVAGEPLALLDFSDLTFSRTDDRTYSEFRTAAPYPITVIGMNPPQYGALKARAGAAIFGNDRYRIGTWWWELPDLPVTWFAAFNDIHELWVGSRFILDTVKIVSPIPVFYVPPIVDPVLTLPVDRREFDLNSSTTVFLTMFDYNSVAERKNPLAIVQAFGRAFRHNEDVCLFVKTMNADRSPSAVRSLEDAAAGDKRVRFLNYYLDRFGIARLLQCCDAFVSLHRAEGFGLGIAEAMAYGKAIVATAWSGNMDFTTAQNSYLVDFELTTLQTDYGPYFAGSSWAEPDIDHAAEQFARIVRHRGEAQRRGSRARYDIRSRFAPAKVAASVRSCIDRIQSTILTDIVTLP